MMNQFSSSSATNLDIQGLWRHSIASASAAISLSRHTTIDQDKAFTAALLHDIGKMVLDIHSPEHYLQVIKYQQEQQCLIRDAEEHILGCDHSEVGALVAQKWKLPNEIINTIRGHHNRADSEAALLSDLVNLSDFVSRGLALGNPGDGFIPALNEEIPHRLSISLENIADSLAEIEALYDSFVNLIE
jgi:putative nucleotidyltransferase with HDIG domain